MKDYPGTKRLAMYRKRGALLTPAPSIDTPPVVSANPAQETDPAKCIILWQQDQVSTNDLGRKITQIAINSPNRDTLLPEIAQALGETLEAEYCAIVVMASDRRLADAGNTVVTPQAWRGRLINHAYWYKKMLALHCPKMPIVYWPISVWQGYWPVLTPWISSMSVPPKGIYRIWMGAKSYQSERS